MPHQTVRQHQSERRLRRIQQALGVHPDGLLGPETLSALEVHLEISLPAQAFSLEVSVKSLSLIVEFEVSSKANYKKKLRRPTWPGESSGVTIGIGYDVGVTSKKQIRLDWEGKVADIDLERLLIAHGIKGIAAKRLAQTLSDIDVPFEIAEDVFFRSTLPRFAKVTRSTYPGVDQLPADAQGMLLSLIYNRGSSLSGSRRKEMAAIKPLISDGVASLNAIADQIESMARLWPDSPGLQKRRIQEATVIRGAHRAYDLDELIRL